ncbi:MAG: M48 family metalloprotease, partial [Myxococcota bacterium]|nr:M48 family metalloprotease [Myxococcota bacterium]
MRRIPRTARTLAALALLALATACAVVTNPVTGERELTVMSTREEVRLGQQSAEAVREQIGLVEEADVAQLADAIGARLAALSPRQEVQYHFAVADMPEPNAFALPGGWIYVSRGLLAITNSEAELANVMGHEVGHVAALHASQRQTRSAWVGLGTLLGAAAAGLA